MTRKSVALLGLGALVLVLLAALPGAATDPEGSVFISTRGSDDAICVIPPHGTCLACMTNGATSAEGARPHFSSGPGNPPVTLTVSNAAEPGRFGQSLAVTEPRVANFTYEPEAPMADEEVRFTDTSTGGPAWWEWTFGDGATSIAQHPVHVFASAGNYTVRLTAYYPGSEIGRDVARTVTVHDPPVGGETAFFSVSTSPRGARISLRYIEGGLVTVGNTSAGPLNVTLYLTGTPVTAIVANLTGYADAVYAVTEYPDPGETVVVNLTLAPALPPVPPSIFAPTDTDADGIFDDVNGNGAADFADIILFFNQVSWIAVNEPLLGFDCNGNGTIDFADVVWLFTNL